VKHGEYLLIIFKEFFENLFIDIIASQGELKPSLGFGCFLAGIAQFVEEDGLVSSLPPSLGTVGKN